MDNKATIFVTANTNSTPRACHIDIKCGWVSQSDKCTKNVSPEVHNAHTPHCLAPRESHRFNLDNEEATEKQGDEVIRAREGVGDESREQFSPNRDSSVVCLVDIITLNQSHRNLIPKLLGRSFALL